MKQEWRHHNPMETPSMPVPPDAIVEGFCVVTGSWGTPCRADMVPWSGCNHVTVYRIYDDGDNTPGILMIAAERRRQIKEEGWTAEHDDENYHDGELRRAACAYALSGMKIYQIPFGIARNMKKIIADIWPWDQKWYKVRGKPTSSIRTMVKAGALLAAAIDQELRDAKAEEK